MDSQIQGSGSLTIDDVYDKIKEGKSFSDKTAYIHPFKTDNKSVRLSLGRIWFNQLLPEDYPLVDYVVNKPEMDKIIKILIDKYDTEVVADALSKIQEEAFKVASMSPNSFVIDSFIPPDEWIIKKKEFEAKYQNIPSKEIDIQKFTKEADQLTKMLVSYLDKQGFRLQNILNSHAKGDPISDWKSLLVSKGFVLDIEGNMRGPILKGISEGVNKVDYYHTAAQARRNYYYKTNMSAKPGYLARKVTMSNANVVLDSTKTDCGTRKYLDIFIDSKKAELIIGRYYLSGNSLKIIKNPEDVVNKKIKLRSPLYCKAKKGICPTCYGTHSNNLSSKNIGILAGGAINKIAVNDMMKMRHKSSQLDIIDIDFQKLINSFKQDISFINKLIDIRKKEIVAKQECTILLDKSKYDDSDFIDAGENFYIPGILDLYVGNISDNKFITFPFNFQVHLNKPQDYTVDGKTIILRYLPGEIIMSQDYYTKQSEPGIIDRLLGGSLKYIDAPETLLDAVYEQLPSSDLVHLELVIANMFRTKDNITIPCRLKDYSDFEIVGVKKLPHINSWLTGLSFEDPSKAIKEALLQQRDNDMNPIEKVLLEKFYDQKERNDRDEP
jgi:hypothetical protein